MVLGLPGERYLVNDVKTTDFAPNTCTNSYVVHGFLNFFADRKTRMRT